mgnify:CR=1 FL=1
MTRPPATRYLRWLVSALLAAIFAVAAHFLPVFLGGGLGAVQAQPAVTIRRVEPAAISAQVYARHPDLPLENNYTDASGTVISDSTLVSRFVRYHLFVKDRPANFRLDWKLTLADYLDSFHPMEARLYPQQDALGELSAEGPFTGDRAAIAQMTRAQRNCLAQSLFEIFTGQAEPSE